MFYRDEYGGGKCIHCQECMYPMDDDNLSNLNWQICSYCFFVCLSSHFISNGCEAHDSWHYIYPIFENDIIIKHILVKNCFYWYYIENKVIKYICTCGNNSCCNNVLQIPNKFPFKIQVFSKN
jgi:hypothetical protein